MSSNTVERIGGVWIDKVKKLKPVEFTDSLVSEKRARDISLEIVEKLKTASIQIISAEVISAIYNENDVNSTPGVDARNIGCVQVKCFPGFTLPTEWVYPLEGNIKKYPVIGELVAILCIGPQAFYFNPINIRRSVNNNSVIGITDTAGKKLEYDSNSMKEILKGFVPDAGRPTRQIAGDVVIDGRTRQSIKLGVNDAGKVNSGPVIKLRIANPDKDATKAYIPRDEDIKLDASSIYLTYNEEIQLSPARNVNETITPSKHSGKQVLIDSDKIVFNTKNGDKNNIGIYSGYNLNLISQNDTNVIGKRVYVGAEPEAVGVQPAVLGDALVDLLYYLASEMQKAGMDLSGATGIGNLGVPSPSPLTQKAGAGLTSAFSPAGKFSKMSLRDALLSKHVYVSKQGK